MGRVTTTQITIIAYHKNNIFIINIILYFASYFQEVNITEKVGA